jgi:protein gp37
LANTNYIGQDIDVGITNNLSGKLSPDQDPFYPRFWPEKLEELRSLSPSKVKPKGIFVCDMSDLFGIGIPEKWIKPILKVIRRNYKHRFYLLTKQPQNLAKFSPFPNNAWVGVSATNPDMEYKAIDCLSKIKAKVKYISYEPLLAYTLPSFIDYEEAGINWIILGSQTKPIAHPQAEWVKSIISQADLCSIPVFVKEPLASHMGIDRQELPE